MEDQRSYYEYASTLDFDTKQLYSKFEKYMPLGVYFSNTFISNNRDFLKSFNTNISICVPDAIRLNIQ